MPGRNVRSFSLSLSPHLSFSFSLSRSLALSFPVLHNAATPPGAIFEVLFARDCTDAPLFTMQIKAGLFPSRPPSLPPSLLPHFSFILFFFFFFFFFFPFFFFFFFFFLWRNPLPIDKSRLNSRLLGALFGKNS